MWRKSIFSMSYDTNSPAYQRYSTQMIERASFIDVIKEQPIVDAVEVVRCRECIHRLENSKMCAHPKAIGWDAIEPEDNDYCSYGERREK